MRSLPVFPLQTVLFPGGPLPLRIFEPRYIDMVGRCMKSGEPFAVAGIIEGSELGAAEFHEVGTLATIADFEQLPDGLLGILAFGGQRVRIHSHERQKDGLHVGRVENLAPESPAAVPPDQDDLARLLRRLLERLPFNYYRETRCADASWVGYRFAEILPLGMAQKQYFLELEDPLRRLEIIRPLIVSLQMMPAD
ncbi:MAG TPA: LON peptidase substrate-binding domain-containing protein [Gammaproteobacteria bacterium]